MISSAEPFTPYWFQPLVVLWPWAESRHDLSSPSIPILHSSDRNLWTSSGWAASRSSTAAKCFRLAFARRPTCARGESRSLARELGVCSAAARQQRPFHFLLLAHLFGQEAEILLGGLLRLEEFLVLLGLVFVTQVQDVLSFLSNGDTRSFRCRPW